jgi:hypothetical protein
MSSEKLITSDLVEGKERPVNFYSLFRAEWRLSSRIVEVIDSGLNKESDANDENNLFVFFSVVGLCSR